ncbi:MAG: two-component sensor histidine kinase [Flavobacteriaceae bacterium]
MGENTIIISLILFNIFFLAFVGGIVIFIRQYRVKKKAHLEELEVVNVLHKEELLQTQVEIQSQTMKHIGREIHDNVGQKLTLSSLYLQQLLLEEKAPETAKEINRINEVINESLDELRHLSKSLTDDTINEFLISELLAQECNNIDKLKECKVRFQSDLTTRIDSYQLKSVLLRITQEFLQNSIKHSKCKNIEVSLSKKKGRIQLFLKDDGKGFDPKKLKTEGIGLKNMQKRVEMIQGVFQLKSAPRKGTELTIEIQN